MNNCFASIEIQNGSNFKKWKKDLEFSLGIADLDMALRKTKPVINDQSTPEEKEKIAKWERSDRLSLCAMKRTISEHLISGFPEKENAKKYLTAIGERFQCVAEEEKLKKERSDLALLTFHAKPHSGKNSWKNKKNTRNDSHRYPKFRKPGNGQHHNVEGPKHVSFMKSFGCFWCKENGHKKTGCHAFKAWLDNKNKSRGNHLAFFCFESNLVDVPINSWWLDSGSITHIDVSLHGFKNQRRPNLRENKLGVGNDLEVIVELLRDVSLVLGTGFELF
ncbi:hypothetical protein KIW84_021658 [Lathyrus oleraceus]|uniref:Uncharacterized protein n=1 Tax=Pisum sativum TaxID=3888 RepID=A0A9D5B4A3_PEA|nr:hypothetical protein KIW84_021658 [Pisum sativum]